MAFFLSKVNPDETVTSSKANENELEEQVYITNKNLYSNEFKRLGL